MELDCRKLDEILDAVYDWSNNQNFLGYNKHDGLNSPVLQFAMGWAKWPRIFAIQTVMRSPINIRPLLLVPKTLNPKGPALFVLGLLDRHSMAPGSGCAEKAESLLDLLMMNQSSGDWAGCCWGYPYPWQDLGFFAPTNTPNAVVTSFVCEALLAAYRCTGKEDYLQTAGSAVDFFLNDLTVLEDTADTLCLSYMPLPMSMRVMDVSILIGAVLAQYAGITGDEELMATAKRLVLYVVSKQSEYGAWYYTDPPGDSPIRHDNYHTGFILDALWRYMKAADDWQWRPNYELGLEFYADKLFNSNGSPRWMSDRDYPHDVHGAAQGLITFSMAARHGYRYDEPLSRIAGWAIENLYNPEGRFYYQQGRLRTKKFTLLRWCNAWMFRGLAAALVLNDK